jgi:hypothetical protein
VHEEQRMPSGGRPRGDMIQEKVAHLFLDRLAHAR